MQVIHDLIFIGLSAMFIKELKIPGSRISLHIYICVTVVEVCGVQYAALFNTTLPTYSNTCTNFPLSYCSEDCSATRHR